MFVASPDFARYIALALQGRNSLWRILLGIVLFLIVYTILLVVIIVAGFLAAYAAGMAALPADTGLEAFLTTIPGQATILASFASVWVGVWLAVRLLHRRPLRTIFGADSRISWCRFGKALVATLLVSAIIEAVLLLVLPLPRQGALTFQAWLWWLIPLGLLFLLQTSAEEALFRGWLLQSLAARFRSPVAWAVMPSVAFALLHWQADLSPGMLAILLGGVLAFALIAVILVRATGDLGAAMGMHLGNNLFSCLLVSHEARLGSGALLVGQDILGGSWSGLQLAALVGLTGAGSLLLLVLLLHPRSPLRVTSAPAVAG